MLYFDHRFDITVKKRNILNVLNESPGYSKIRVCVKTRLRTMAQRLRDKPSGRHREIGRRTFTRGERGQGRGEKG